MIKMKIAKIISITFIILSLTTIVSSCHNNKKYRINVNKTLHIKIQNDITKWNKTQNIEYLEDAYQIIKKSNMTEIDEPNTQLISTVLFGLKKYDELLTFLKKYQNKHYSNLIQLTIYQTNYFKYKGTPKEKYFIKKIISSYKDSIRAHPKDTLYYVDLFMYKSKIFPQKTLLKEIDSLKRLGRFDEVTESLILKYMNNNSF